MHTFKLSAGCSPGQQCNNESTCMKMDTYKDIGYKPKRWLLAHCLNISSHLVAIREFTALPDWIQASQRRRSEEAIVSS